LSQDLDGHPDISAPDAGPAGPQRREIHDAPARSAPCSSNPDVRRFALMTLKSLWDLLAWILFAAGAIG
jgi:hypothetical protein